MSKRKIDELLDYLPLDDLKTLNDDVINKIIEVNEAIYATDSTIASAIDKMARYAIVDFEITVNNKAGYENKIVAAIVSQIRSIIDKVRLKELLINMGVDYYIYGTAVAVIDVVGDRYFYCPKCKNLQESSSYYHFFELTQTHLRDMIELDENGFLNFKIKCLQCQRGEKLVYLDSMSTDWIKMKENLPEHKKDLHAQELNLIIKQWNYKELSIKANKLTSHPIVIIRREAIRKHVEEILDMNDFEILEQVPIDYIKFYFINSDLKPNYKRVGIIRFPIPSGVEVTTLPPLGRAYRYSLLLLEIIGTILETARDTVPFKIIYTPQDVEYPSVSSPIIGWEQRKNIIENTFREMLSNRKKWAYFPFQVAETSVGGRAAGYWLTSFLEILKNNILDATNMPKALILSDGVNWSASIIAIRLLENTLLNYVNDINDFLRKVANLINIMWLSKKYPGVEINITLQPFKRMDSIQETMLIGNILGPDKVMVEPYIKSFFGLSLEEYLSRVAAERAILSKYDITENITRQLASVKLEEFLQSELGGEVEADKQQEGQQTQEQESEEQQEENTKQANEEKDLPINKIEELANDILRHIAQNPSIIKEIIRKFKNKYGLKNTKKLIAILLDKVKHMKERERKQIEKALKSTKGLSRRPRGNIAGKPERNPGV